ncbi:hypothetical protein NPIL_105241 [Nephila pilipes]|uniref:Uncharacterized protein n=1 Tax=Nephila pilipes TaxID=299642 RepID=A0A8X6N4Z7_NEPPI|nr:hypothetical protein NPIL_105241 [Nephila pilipes]
MLGCTITDALKSSVEVSRAFSLVSLLQSPQMEPGCILFSVFEGFSGCVWLWDIQRWQRRPHETKTDRECRRKAESDDEVLVGPTRGLGISAF